MLKLSVCVEMVFDDKSIKDKIRKVAEAGLSYFEFWGWTNKDLNEIAEAARTNNVTPRVFGVKGANIVDLSEKELYIDGVKASIDAAQRLGVKTLITTTGMELNSVPRQSQHAAIVECLKAAAPIVEAAGITLVLEPLNVLVDHEGYYLYSSDEGFEIIDEVDSPNIRLLFDIYHQQITEGHVISRIKNNIQKIGHFHVADNPGRNEPGTGELNYKNIFTAIKETGYEGYVGLEYRPTKDPIETLVEIAAIA